MASQFQVSRSTAGTNMPGGNTTSSSGQTDTFNSVVPASGTIASLGTTFQQIVNHTTDTTGAGLLEIFIPGGIPAGQALMIANNSSGTNAVNVGNGAATSPSRSWYSLGFTPGTSDIYIASSTGTIANVTYEKK